MAVMRKVLAAAAVSAAIAGAGAGPASADVLSDLGVSTTGLTTLPAGFDPLSFDPLSIEITIGLPKAAPLPVDMTTKWMPVGEPLKKSKPAGASKKRKKSRRARRG